MKILFKCDKSNTIGLGHYYRCLALAKVFKKKGHECFFLGLKSNIKKKNRISVKEQYQDVIFTYKFIKKNKIDIVIKDLYCLNFFWERKIEKNYFLVVIDDLRDQKHFCNVYVNYHFNYFQKKHMKNIETKFCKKLVGPKFAIINDIKLKKKKIINIQLFLYIWATQTKR